MPSRVGLPREAGGAGAGDVGRVLGERVVDELALFEFVDGVGAGGGARRSGATRVEGALTSREQSGQTRLDDLPAAVVLRLLLTPDELRRLLVRREDFAQRAFGERVELFEPNDGNAVVFRLLPCRREVVEDLAAADDDAPHSRLVCPLRVVDDGREPAGR